MDSQVFRFMKEGIQELDEIFKGLEEDSSKVRAEGQNFVSEFKTDVKNIKQQFEKIFLDYTEEDKKEENIKTVEKKIENSLQEIKPFIEKLIHEIKEPQPELSDVVDIASLKMKLASLYAKVFVKKKVSEAIHKIKEINNKNE